MNVLITGAAGGLGRAMAAECASRGFNLFLTDANPLTLAAIASGISRRFDVRVFYRAADLRSAQAIDELLHFFRSFDNIDMLLNVMGVDFEGPFLSRSEEQISSIISTNILATLNLTHKILRLRHPSAPLFIVFISSLASLFPMPLKACYAASKRFLFDFALALSYEFKHSPVSVTTVCPGGLFTSDVAISAITAQGFWGAATSNNLESLARRSLSLALRRKHLYIPGLLNRFLAALSFLTPRSLAAKLIFSRWNSLSL